MKLIYIVNSRLPTERAYGIQVSKMCEAFAQSSIKIILLYPRRDNPIKEKDIFSYYGIGDRFEIKELFSIDLLKYKFLRGFSFWTGAFSFYLSVFFYILFKLQDFKYIYTRDFFSASLLKILGKKVIFELHNLPKSKTRFLRRLLEANDKIITITKRLKDDLVKLGIKQKNIIYLADGVDLKKFNILLTKEQARKKLNLPQNKKLILYTGHLYEWKGASVLLEAAQYLQDFLVVFVGGKEEDLRNFQLSISNFQLKNVLLAGHRFYEEIPYWLKSADVLVLPNSAKDKISKFYTSPLKLFEYMASARPIVASNLPSIREILSSENAFLVEPDNPQSLAQAVEKVLESQELSDRISKKAFEDVKGYTWKNRAKKIIDFLI